MIDCKIEFSYLFIALRNVIMRDRFGFFVEESFEIGFYGFIVVIDVGIAIGLVEIG